MLNRIAAVALLVCSSCYAEWDIPKVPRRDPCFGTVENKLVYVEPACPAPRVVNPRDQTEDTLRKD